MVFGTRSQEHLIPTGSNLAQRWAKWRKSFETYFTAAEISKKTPAVQVAILLNAAGDEAQEIHTQFIFDEGENKDDVQIVLKKFTSYCNPRKNTVFERYKFWSRLHLEEEPIDKWVKDLRIISANCEYKDEDEQIRDKIVFQYRDRKVIERIIRENTPDLQKVLEICRAAESTRNHMKSMCSNERSTEISVQEVQQFSNMERNGYRERSNTEGQFRTDITCYNCSGTGHLSRDCPSGDNFPRGRSNNRRGRSANRGNRGGRGRSSSSRGRSSNRNNRGFHEITQDEIVDPLAEFQTLSLSAVSINVINKETTTVTKRYAL